VGGLAGLGELLRITNHNEVLRGACDGEDVGQGQLARLVDEQGAGVAAELRAGSYPGGCGGYVQAAVAQAPLELVVTHRGGAGMQVGLSSSARWPIHGTVPRSHTALIRLAMTACEGRRCRRFGRGDELEDLLGSGECLPRSSTVPGSAVRIAKPGGDPYRRVIGGLTLGTERPAAVVPAVGRSAAPSPRPRR
jgi:hypothetical protein